MKPFLSHFKVIDFELNSQKGKKTFDIVPVNESKEHKIISSVLGTKYPRTTTLGGEEHKILDMVLEEQIPGEDFILWVALDKDTKVWSFYDERYGEDKVQLDYLEGLELYYDFYSYIAEHATEDYLEYKNLDKLKDRLEKLKQRIDEVRKQKITT